MNENRIPYKKVLVFNGIVLAIMFAISAWAWFQLPAGASIPVHWNAAGEADRFGGKFEGLLVMPLVALGITILLAVVPSISPKGENIQRSGTAYTVLSCATLLLMFALYIASLTEILGWFTNPLRWTFTTIFGIFFIVLGNYMGKIRHNYMFGVRTPWTIASEQSWNKTHRITGRIWVVVGILTLLTGLFISVALSSYVMLVGILGSTLFALIYSYLVWKNDPLVEPR